MFNDTTISYETKLQYRTDLRWRKFNQIKEYTLSVWLNIERIITGDLVKAMNEVNNVLNWLIEIEEYEKAAWLSMEIQKLNFGLSKLFQNRKVVEDDPNLY